METNWFQLHLCRRYLQSRCLHPNEQTGTLLDFGPTFTWECKEKNDKTFHCEVPASSQQWCTWIEHTTRRIWQGIHLQRSGCMRKCENWRSNRFWRAGLQLMFVWLFPRLYATSLRALGSSPISSRLVGAMTAQAMDAHLNQGRQTECNIADYAGYFLHLSLEEDRCIWMDARLQLVVHPLKKEGQLIRCCIWRESWVQNIFWIGDMDFSSLLLMGGVTRRPQDIALMRFCRGEVWKMTLASFLVPHLNRSVVQVTGILLNPMIEKRNIGSEKWVMLNIAM